jgi:hypothetical protein
MPQGSTVMLVMEIKILYDDFMNVMRGIKRLIVFLFLSIIVWLCLYGFFIDEPLSFQEKLIMLVSYGIALWCFQYVLKGFKKETKENRDTG